MANTVIAIKKSATPAAQPTVLANGELAINYADGKLFYKHANGTILPFNTQGGNAFGTVNANGTLVVAGSSEAVVTLIAGNNISIIGDAINDTVTIESTGGGPAFDKANSANIIAVASFAAANAALGSVTTVLIATHTSNTSSSGTANSSSNYSSGYLHWKAYDGLTGTTNHWFSATTTGWIGYDFLTYKTVTQYSITGVSSSFGTNRSPNAWTLEASNNGTSWANLDYRSGQTWSSLEVKTFDITNTSSYLRYRINVTTAVAGALLGAAEVSMSGVEQNSGTWYRTSSGKLSIVANTSFAHGLGAVPNRLYACMECTTADAPFAVGERLYLCTEENTSSGRGGMLWASDTAAYFSMYSTPVLYLVGRGVNGWSPTLANWRIILTAEL